jgi:hypothetical protein
VDTLAHRRRALASGCRIASRLRIRKSRMFQERAHVCLEGTHHAGSIDVYAYDLSSVVDSENVSRDTLGDADGTELTGLPKKSLFNSGGKKRADDLAGIVDGKSLRSAAARHVKRQKLPLPEQEAVFLERPIVEVANDLSTIVDAVGTSGTTVRYPDRGEGPVRAEETITATTGDSNDVAAIVD